jgi:hypothetical protein
MEVFLRYIKRKHINCPDVITRDNVNMKLYSDLFEGDEDPEGWTFLEEAVYIHDTETTSWLLNLNATISYFELSNCQVPSLLNLLLEAGGNPNCYNGEFIINDRRRLRYHWFCEMLIDYGSDTSNMVISHLRGSFDYVNLSNHRVQVCRQTLLGLIRVCKGSKYLRGLRGVILEIAKQVWAMRGGEGCGPRGKRWVY